MYRKNITPGKVWGSPIYLMLVLLLASVISGCALNVKMVGEYDQIVDKSVMELQQSTATFFTQMKAASDADRSYEVNKDFYAQAEGKISGLIIRSEVIEEGLKRDALTQNFRHLKEQYTELAEAHKNNPSKRYFGSAEDAFNQSYRAILKHLLYLKWNQTSPKS